MFAIVLPPFDPVAVSVGPLAVRWYALAYICGFLAAWAYAHALVRSDRLWSGTRRPDPANLIDLVLYAMVGTVVGGRLGQVIFYEPAYYAARPIEIVELWNGGMSFHGGLIGVLLAIWYFARRFRIAFLTVADLVAVVCPIAVFLVRIGNFINSEHWGRPTDVPWAVVFPDVDALPRHPSQLYEGALEGLLLFIVLGLFAQKGAFRRPGLLTGIAALGYALARIAMEFFREPDPQIEQLPLGLTMGMVLSAPMAVVGIGLILYAARSRRSAGATELSPIADESADAALPR